MKTTTLNAYAKINIGLDITGKLDNGYHLIKTIMQQVDLYDVVKVSYESGEEPATVEFICNTDNVPLDNTNLAYKAALKMIEKYGICGKIIIDLDKRIPVAAGMAGGSTDGAAVLIGINEVCDLHKTVEELCETGVKLGADVPFCIMGGCALCEGIGEKLTPISVKPDMYTVISKPSIGISTKYVYEHLKLSEVSHPDMDMMLRAFANRDFEAVINNLGNVLESVSEVENEIISQLKAAQLQAGAAGSLMSGSGPTVFGLYRTMDEAAKAEKILKEQFKDVFVKAVALR